MSTRGDQREEATERVLLSFWAKKGPRGQLCPFKHCLEWQEQLTQLGSWSLLQERVSHIQIATASVLWSTGAQWYGLLNAAGIKGRVQKINVFYWFGGLWCPDVVSLGTGQVQARARSSKLSFLAGIICPPSIMPWLWKDPGCVSWGCRNQRFGSASCWISEPGSALLLCVCVPGSMLFNSAWTGSKAGTSGLFPQLLDASEDRSCPTGAQASPGSAVLFFKYDAVGVKVSAISCCSVLQLIKVIVKGFVAIADIVKLSFEG